MGLDLASLWNTWKYMAKLLTGYGLATGERASVIR
ncbi:hypothetical protein SAMN06265218_12419 [Fodinibius sediminis]|uniref:Uncharacterized protein n=1 Tax=Fodinibius sediminis TaxID=1214077 RepID=A0A521F691_9BACT|nr:hypothetical protein SAMN06265218_12419 [Fodinibius sediminis]